MDTDAKGQLGGMDASEEVRRRFAAQSKTSKCATCGRTNDEIMREQDEVVKEHGGEGKAETVPDELRLAYREDLGKANGKPDGPDASAAEKATTTSSPPAPADTPVNSVPAAATSTETDVRQRQRPLNPPPATATVNLPPIAGHQRDDVPGWVDKAIYGILAVLIFLLCKRIAA
jgi:ubiquitin-conjugating enzyme E2 J1